MSNWEATDPKYRLTVE